MVKWFDFLNLFSFAFNKLQTNLQNINQESACRNKQSNKKDLENRMQSCSGRNNYCVYKRKKNGL